MDLGALLHASLSPICGSCWRAGRVVPFPSGKVSWRDLRIPACFTALFAGLRREVIYVLLHTTNQRGRCCLQWWTMQDRWVYLASVSKKTLSLGQFLLIHLLQTLNSTLVVLCYVHPGESKGMPLKKPKALVPFSLLPVSLGPVQLWRSSSFTLSTCFLLPVSLRSVVCFFPALVYAAAWVVFLFGWFCP